MPGPAVWGAANRRRSLEDDAAANVTEIEVVPVVRQHARDLGQLKNGGGGGRPLPCPPGFGWLFLRVGSKVMVFVR